MEMHPHHHQPKYRPHAINECSLVPRLTSTMERATAVIVGGNEVDECKMEASSSDKTPVGTGRRRQQTQQQNGDASSSSVLIEEFKASIKLIDY